MSVPRSSRKRYNRVGEIKVDGKVVAYKYKYINWKGEAESEDKKPRVIVTKQKGDQLGISKNVKKKAGPKTAFGKGNYATSGKDFNFDEALGKSDTFREKVISTIGGKAYEYYKRYAKNNAVPQQIDEINEIRSQGNDNWKKFLRWGLGLNKEASEKYGAENSQYAVTDNPSLTEEEYRNLKLTNEDLNSWAAKNESGEFLTAGDPLTAQEGEGYEAPKLLKEESELQEEDLKGEERKDWIESHTGLSEQQKEDLLKGTGDYQGLLSQLDEEKEARSAYRDAIGGEQGYAKELERLYQDFTQGKGSEASDRRSALNQLLDEYKDSSPNRMQEITESLQQDIEASKELQARTGLKRDDTTISEMVKDYMPEIQEDIDAYRDATGQSQEEAMSALSNLRDTYKQGIQDQQRAAGTAWETLQSTIEGPESFASAMANQANQLALDRYQEMFSEFGTDSLLGNWMSSAPEITYEGANTPNYNYGGSNQFESNWSQCPAGQTFNLLSGQCE